MLLTEEKDKQCIKEPTICVIHQVYRHKMPDLLDNMIRDQARRNSDKLRLF